MSEFDIFTIDTKINENTIHVQKLKRALAKIKSNQQNMQVKSIERVNKVALFNVLITRTSDYMIKLNNDYFAKVKSNTAEKVVEARIDYFEDQNKKWLQMKDKIVKSAEKEKLNEESEKDFNNKFKSNLEVIGQNEEGEEIFNIVEYSQSEKQPIRASRPNEKVEQKTEKIEKPNINQTQIKKQRKIEVPMMPTITENQPVKEQVISVPVEEKPKKISKFKAERLHNKQK